MSAWNCISSSFSVMPPSTRSSPSCSSPVTGSTEVEGIGVLTNEVVAEPAR